MRKSNHAPIRALLRIHTDGLTVLTMSEMSGISTNSVLASLKCMPDAYIDRWKLARGKDAGVWCVVVPPEDCPKPDRRKK